jgi:hypothetical protein
LTVLGFRRNTAPSDAVTGETSVVMKPGPLSSANLSHISVELAEVTATAAMASTAMVLTAERAEKLVGHSALGWGVHIREFLHRHEAAAIRLVCTKLRETVDCRWTFPVCLCKQLHDWDWFREQHVEPTIVLGPKSALQDSVATCSEAVTDAQVSRTDKQTNRTSVPAVLVAVAAGPKHVGNYEVLKENKLGRGTFFFFFGAYCSRFCEAVVICVCLDVVRTDTMQVDLGRYFSASTSTPKNGWP